MKKGTCTPMFTVALYAKAKTWKQSKSPLTDEWFKKIYLRRYIYIYIYVMEYIYICNGIYLCVCVCVYIYIYIYIYM